jgi:hydrogenase nickel incorporation protein HypA/HybF
MQNLMQKIEAIAEQNDAERVTGVKVWLGALSHFSREHFQQHFDVAAKGSRAEGAQLMLELSDDEQHPRAQDVILESIEVDDG